LTVYNRCAIEEYLTENGPADYALCVNGHILGVIEAKKLSLGPQNVLIQERYSKGVQGSSCIGECHEDCFAGFLILPQLRIAASLFRDPAGGYRR
jgi:hypothetical protein